MWNVQVLLASPCPPVHAQSGTSKRESDIMLSSHEVIHKPQSSADARRAVRTVN
ncbi:hypothetical protein SCLCIDRAFT_1222380 [Scleroderma citrinum Foug A]|uniref:Uncharacterized protein n=1 Tax=Scleroderma citrinum Foug A TaxID=1036808 RepID=A0A0C2YWG0_9AGAM|nr:hypothetical protein SCLCIDRAFT_1222380 [Scleroderma citrinum Foug A]